MRGLAEKEGSSLVRADLAWVLSHNAVSTVIPGVKSPAQIEENVKASEMTLSSNFLERVRALPGS